MLVISFYLQYCIDDIPAQGNRFEKKECCVSNHKGLTKKWKIKRKPAKNRKGLSVFGFFSIVMN